MKKNKKWILVVDDVDFVRKQISSQLIQKTDFEVKEASNGKDAVQLTIEIEPSLVILDLNMPDYNGLYYIQEMGKAVKRSPILILSGEDREVLNSAKVLAEKFKVPIVGTAAKPVRYKHLLEFIQLGVSTQKLIGRSSQSDSLTSDEIHQAITEGWLKPYYQPQLNLKTNRLHGIEALARIEHPDQGVVAPACFINSAILTKLMKPLTESMIEQSFRDFALLLTHSPELTLSVNVSADVLETSEFPHFIEECAIEYAVDPSQIVVELTESVLPSHPEMLLFNMLALRLMRFSLSVDDFGTGFASLGQLSELPFQELKIDRTFISAFRQNRNLWSIVNSTIKLALELELRIIAEGVEKQEESAEIQKLGCHLMQGYLFSKPIPFTELESLLKNNVQLLEG